MVRLILVVLLPLCSAPALAQDAYKCRINGNFVYQDRPCPGSVRYSNDFPVDSTRPSASRNAQVDGGAVGAGAVSGSQKTTATEMEREKAFLSARKKEKKLADLRSQLSDGEERLSALSYRRDAELAELDRQGSYANNNLAGATYRQSLATDKQAVTARYESEILSVRDRLKHLREELSRAEKE